MNIKSPLLYTSFFLLLGFILNMGATLFLPEPQAYAWNKETGQLYTACTQNRDLNTAKEILDGSSDTAAIIKDSGVLHEASINGDIELVKLLLTYPLDINDRTEDEGKTALHWAAGGGHIEVVRLLIQHGATIMIRDNFAMDPLSTAAFFGRNDIILLFLENGIDINTKGPYGTPIEVAHGRGHGSTVTLLREKGATLTRLEQTESTKVFVKNGVEYRLTSRDNAI